MTFSPEQYIFSFLLGLITAILSASIFAYWSGVYKVKGELTARREQIDEILNEIRATASAMEVSKVTGRAQALDKILEEVEKTAKATEVNKIAGRTEKLDEILKEVKETARASEVSKITGRTEKISEILDEVKQTEQVRIDARLAKLDENLREVRVIAEAQKGIERRSRFEEKIILDRYTAASDLHTRINQITTNLNRHRSGIVVEGLFMGTELVPLTGVFEALETARYLLGRTLTQNLIEQAGAVLDYGNADSPDSEKQALGRYGDLRKQFSDEMNRIFSIEKIGWA